MIGVCWASIYFQDLRHSHVLVGGGYTESPNLIKTFNPTLWYFTASQFCYLSGTFYCRWAASTNCNYLFWLHIESFLPDILRAQCVDFRCSTWKVFLHSHNYKIFVWTPTSATGAQGGQSRVVLFIVRFLLAKSRRFFPRSGVGK